MRNDTIHGVTSTATAAGTTTLTAISNPNQIFTGTTTQTVEMPVVTTLYTGWQVTVFNDSTGAVTINSSGSNLIATLSAGQRAQLTCNSISANTTASAWELQLTATSISSSSSSAPRVGSTASTATPSINVDLYDIYQLTALAANITGVTITGTPSDGQRLTVQITGTASRSIVWGASFKDTAAVELPWACIGTRKLTAELIYDSADSKWLCVAVVGGIVEPPLSSGTPTTIRANGNATVTEIGTLALTTSLGALSSGGYSGTSSLQFDRSTKVKFTANTSAWSAGWYASGSGRMQLGNGSGLGGFFWSSVFTLDTTVANTGGVAIGAFFGIAAASSAPTNAYTHPDTLPSVVGVACHSDRENLQFIHAGTSAQTRVDLGTDFKVFPYNTVTTQLFQLMLYSDPSVAGDVFWCVKNLQNGSKVCGVVLSGTNLPATSVELSQFRVVISSNQSTTTTSLLPFYLIQYSVSAIRR